MVVFVVSTSVEFGEASINGSVYSDNRALDALGRSLGALIGGVALFSFAATRAKPE
jgi:hypothetical protein